MLIINSPTPGTIMKETNPLLPKFIHSSLFAIDTRLSEVQVSDRKSADYALFISVPTVITTQHSFKYLGIALDTVDSP